MVIALVGLVLCLVVYFFAQRKTIRVETELALLKEAKQQLLEENQLLRAKCEEQVKVLAEQRTSLFDLSSKIDLQKKEQETMQEQMSIHFDNLAHKIFEEKSEIFHKRSSESLEGILKPLKEKMSEFKDKVESVHKEDTIERTKIEMLVKQMNELNQRLSDEANNLTKALKGDSKRQGNWGEMILERVLEMSGLHKNEEFFVQEHITLLKDKGILIPDAIIQFPEEKRVIIDAKVSITAYSNSMNCEDGTEKDSFLKAHWESVLKHIDELSEKNYPSYVENSLGYVMMFIPNESSYFAALQYASQKNEDLWGYAYKKNVLLMCPSNLLAALRFVYEMWTREKQYTNIDEILNRSTELYEKFVNFTNDMEAIHTHLDRASKAYSDASNKLSRGKGNLIARVENLKELGIRRRIGSNKKIPSSFLAAPETKELSEES